VLCLQGNGAVGRTGQPAQRRVVKACGDGLGTALASVTVGLWAWGVKDELKGRSPVKWSAVNVSS
jgi:uncharacterized protein (DUF697 family)